LGYFSYFVNPNAGIARLEWFNQRGGGGIGDKKVKSKK